MVSRVVQRRKSPYSTLRNRIKHVKTPSNKLVARYIKKNGIKKYCDECKVRLPGIKVLRPEEMAQAKRKDLTGKRIFSGMKCGSCVKKLVVRSFLREEHNVVKE